MAKVLTEYVIPALHHSLYYFISYKEQLLQLGSHQSLVDERGGVGQHKILKFIKYFVNSIMNRILV